MGEVQTKGTNGHGQEPEAIIPAAPAAIAIPAEQTVEQMLARSERQIAFRKGILKLIAANLGPDDITLYGEGDKETIWLTKHACKQILSWAGIRVMPDEGIQEKRYDGVEGPYVDFEVWATWYTIELLPHRTMGNRSTYDDFFAKRTKWSCEGCGAEIRWDDRKPICKAENKQVKAEKTIYYLPLSEVDIPSVKQAAITNMWNHVVEDAGLKPSKKELLAVGFKFEEVKDRVKFGGNQAPKQASTSTPPGAAATPGPKQSNAAAPAVPKAQLPKTEKKAKPAAELPIGKGIVSEAYKSTTRPKDGKGGGTPYLKIVQNGHFLFCFHSGEIETRDGARGIQDLIIAAKGQFCEFVVTTKQKDGQQMHNIDGARRIGVYQWDEQGQPIVPMREPGDDDGYQAQDEDIPF